jgi:hypothetical protein
MMTLITSPCTKQNSLAGGCGLERSQAPRSAHDGCALRRQQEVTATEGPPTAIAEKRAETHASTEGAPEEDKAP